MNSAETPIKESLQAILSNKVNEYLKTLDIKNLSNFHEIYLEQVEPPLLDAVMEKTKYNQVRASKILGISRGTLRKKLIKHFDDKYCGKRDE